MLVLSREVNESIVIGDSIVVTVLAVAGDQVKIGISAPQDVPIWRREVFDAVQDQVRIQQLLADDPDSNAFDGLRALLNSESDPDASALAVQQDDA